MGSQSSRSEVSGDTLVVHQFGRGPWCPSHSNYPIKLETYLRMAKIPYEVSHGLKFSKKGKIPWISFQGEQLGDTHLIIEHLNKKLGIDLNSHLTAEQKAIGRAFQTMIEDNLYWVGVMERYLFMDRDELVQFQGPSFPVPDLVLRYVLPRSFRKATHAQGMGRHSRQEALHFAYLDLDAVSTYLGEKLFLFGESASEFDCTVFGMLCQCIWGSPGSPVPEYIKEKCPNLVEYCGRMKETFWPDWDDCITHGHTRKATK